MQAVILAAGYGSRLGHHTRETPKALLKIGGRPIIFYTLETIRKNGIDDVVIVTGHKAFKIREYVKSFDITFNFIHNSLYRRTNNIYSLYLAMKAVSNDFYIINSDVFFHPDIFEWLHMNRRRNLVLSVDTIKRLGKEEMKVKIQNGRVTRISKEISPSDADGEYIGIAKVHSRAIEDLRSHIDLVIERKGRRVFYEEAFQSMIDYGCIVNFESTKGLPWIEIDTPTDLLVARHRIYREIYGLRRRGRDKFYFF